MRWEGPAPAQTRLVAGASHGGFYAWRQSWGGCGGRLGLDFGKIFLVFLEEGEPEARNRLGSQCRGEGGSGLTSAREALEEKRGARQRHPGKRADGLRCSKTVSEGSVQSGAQGSGQGRALQAALVQELSRDTAEKGALWSGWGSADEGARAWLRGRR